MSRSRRKYEPQVDLGSSSGGSGSHVMQWNPVLGIFRYVIFIIEEVIMESMIRVNRYQTQFTLDKKIDKYKYEFSKMDFLEEFLCRNMDHCAEYVISLLDFEVTF